MTPALAKDEHGEALSERSTLIVKAWEALTAVQAEWIGYDGLVTLIDWVASGRRPRWAYENKDGPFYHLNHPRVHRRFEIVLAIPEVVQAIARCRYILEETEKQWIDRVGIMSREAIERAIMGGDTKVATRMIEYQLGTPARRAEATRGDSPGLLSINVDAVKFADTIVAGIRASNEARPSLPAQNLVVDAGEPEAGGVGRPGLPAVHPEPVTVGPDPVPEAVHPRGRGRAKREK